MVVDKMKNEPKQINVGMFIGQGLINKLVNKDYSFWGYDRLFYIFKANKQVNTNLYCFSQDDVDFNEFLITGTYYNWELNSWEQAKFPIPDVVYDRQGDAGEFVRNVFNTIGVKRINTQYKFNKFEVYEKLQADANLRPNLPLTVLLKSRKDLKNMFAVWEKLYIKACRSEGRGKHVMRVKKQPQGGYECSYLYDELVVHRANTLKGVMKFVRSIFGKRPLMVQQAIDLIEVDGGIIDARIEVQRNGKGELEINGFPFRVGTPGSPISTHSGAYKIEDLLGNRLKYDSNRIVELKEKIERFVIQVYLRIEEVYGAFGEIGIDIGVDKEDNLWFIECNARSAKVSIGNAYDEETVMKVYTNPLEYAQYLCVNKKLDFVEDLPKPIVAVMIGKGLIGKLVKQDDNVDCYWRIYGRSKTMYLVGGTLYYFSPEDVDLENKKITGTYFNVFKRRWEKMQFPFPNVLYDRYWKAGDFVRDAFDLLDIKRINPKWGFDKWELFERLSVFDEIVPHLPKTYHANFTQLRSILTRMFKKSDTVYIKACESNRGRKVIRVTKTSDGFEYRYFVNGLLKTYKADSLYELYIKLRKFFKNHQIIVQQAIDLIEVDNSLVDLRAEVQRNGQGVLKIMGIMARIGQPNSPITTQGQAKLLKDYLIENSKYDKEDINKIMERVQDLCEKVYKRIEEIYGPFGELGIDLALDKNGDIWFFEANARTEGAALMKVSDERTMQEAFMNPLQYAKFITGL